MSDKYFTFTDRPIPLYPSYRPMFKISQILLILYYNGFGGKASLLKLHLFSWALKSESNSDVLKNYVLSNFNSTLTFFGIESTLNRALNLAYAEKLIGFDSGNYFLLEKGGQFAESIDQDDELFIDEKHFLKTIGKKVTENRIKNLVKEWKHA